MIINKNVFDELKDCFMGGIPMKEFTFDLQLFDETTSPFKLKFEDGNVIGYMSNAGTDTDLFQITGVDTTTGLAFAVNATSDSAVITVDSDAKAFNDKDVEIDRINSNGTYTLQYKGSQTPTYAWKVTDKTATYSHGVYYTLDSNSKTLTYNATKDEFKLKLSVSGITADALSNTFVVDTDGNITVKKYSENKEFDATSDGLLSSSATIETIKGSANYQFNEIDTSISTFTATHEHLSIDSNAGVVTIKGDWNAGYQLSNKSKTLTFYEAKSDTVLASITGLAKSTIVEAQSDTYLSFNTDSDVVKFHLKGLTSGNATIKNAKNPLGTANTYTLDLYSDAMREDAGGSILSNTNIWAVNSSNQATFKNVAPEYYTLDSTSNTIIYKKQEDKKTLGVIKGLAIPSTLEGVTKASDIKLVDANNKSVYDASDASVLKISYVTDTSMTPITVAAITTSETGVGTYTFTVNGNVLPTNGTKVTLSSTSNKNSTLKLGEGLGPQKALSDTQPTWSFTGGTGVLNAKLSNGYLLSADGKTITNDIAGTGISVAKITNLNPNIPSSTTSALGSYLSIEGYASDTYVGKADGGIGTSDTITITLHKDALNKKSGVAVTSPKGSFTYALALDSDAKLVSNGGSIATDTNIWTFSGNKATYKNVTLDHYTLDTKTGKINYTAQKDNFTYATLDGLNSKILSSSNISYTTDGTIVYLESGANSDTYDVSDTKLIQVIGDNITIYSDTALTTKDVTLTNGSKKVNKETIKFTYSLGATDVTTPDITHKWWTIDTKTKVAELHQTTQAGYKVDEKGSKLIYHKATDTATGKILATISGLSSDVKVFDTSGKVVDATSIQLGISLGIASETLAHSTWSNTFVTGSDQTITFTSAMFFDKKNVTLTDKDTKDDEKFKLVLGGDVATEAVAANSWAVTGNASKTTLTYQDYKKGYYTKKSDSIIQYTKDTTKKNLFSLTLTDADRDPTVYIDNNGTLQIGTDTFVNVGTTDTKKITLMQVASTETDNVVAFKSLNKDFNSYTLATSGTVPTVVWTAYDASSDTSWTINSKSKIATYSLKVATDGYQSSANNTTLTYRSDSQLVPIFTLSGLKTGITDTDFASVTYDTQTHKLTVNQAFIGDATNIKIKPISKTDSYTLALDDDVDTDHSKANYAEFSKGTLTLKNGYTEYYSITGQNSDTLVYNKAKPESTLAVVKGLKTNAFSDPDTFRKWASDNVTFGSTTINITSDVVTTSSVNITTGKDTYSLSFSDINGGTFSNTWTFKSGTAELKTKSSTDTWILAPDSDSIVFTAQGKENQILKLTGLNPDLKETDVAITEGSFQTANSIKGISVSRGDVASGLIPFTVTVDNDALTTKNASVSTSNKNTYKPILAFSDSQSTETTVFWTHTEGKNNNHTFTLRNANKIYYTLNDKSDTAKYNASKGVDLFKISGNGFSTAITSQTDTNAAITAFNKYVTSDTANHEINIGTDSGFTYLTTTDTSKYLTVTTPKIKGSSDTYTYSINFTAGKVTEEGSGTWKLDGKSLVLSNDLTAGYKLDKNKLSFADATTGSTIFTISGLDFTKAKEAGIALTDTADITAYVNSETSIAGNIVTIGKDLLGKSKVSIKNSGMTTYELGIASDVATSTEPTNTWNGWKYQSVIPAHYATDTGGSSIKYTALKVDKTLGTVTGLKGSYDSDMGTGTALTVDAAHLVGASKVKATGSVTLQLAADVHYRSALTPVATGQWGINGTTATKRDGTPAYYSLSDKEITFHKEANAKKTFATITGLKPGAQVTESSTSYGFLVTLDSSDLTTTNVTITDGKDAGTATYRLKIANDINTNAGAITFEETSSWTTKGSTGTLAGNIASDAYVLNMASDTVTFLKAGKSTFATFANLTSAPTFNAETKTITLKNDSKKITVKTNPYSLAIKPAAGSDIVGSAEADKFIIANGNIKLSAGAGSDLIDIGNSNSGISIGGGAGNDSIGGEGKSDLIVLGDAGNDTVSITGSASKVGGGAGNDYISVAKAASILGDAGDDTIRATDKISSIISGGAGDDNISLTGGGSFGIKGDAGNDFIAIAANAGAVEIYGGAGSDTIIVAGASGAYIFGDAGNDKITFTGGGSVYGGAGNDTIEVTAASGAYIFGDAGDDSISFTGKGTVSGGKGDDKVSLGGGDVTFYYASGDGNDEVTGFDASDTFKLKSGKIKEAALKSNDLILTIGSAKVTLFAAAGDTSVLDGNKFIYKSGEDKATITVEGAPAATPAQTNTTESEDSLLDGENTILVSSNDLIYEDNNLMTPGDISDLVSTNSITEYAIGNYNLAKPDEILSEIDLLTYGDDKNGNNK